MEGWLKEQLELQGVVALTTVQRAALDAGIAVGESMVVCAPTSSGKTLVGEIALLAGVRGKHTALYLVSHKALADQKFDDFKKKYSQKGGHTVARVGISTGDRDEGDTDPQILIATYEKALSLVMSDAIRVGNTVVIADELQIIGEDGRGPEVEILCAALRRRRPKQFVALTATIDNGADIAGWLDCKLIQTTTRDVDLIQEIWANGQVFSVRFGEDTGSTHCPDGGVPNSTLDAVAHLLKNDRGPVLVFTETRRDAMALADAFSRGRSKTPTGFNFADQLALFSEATEFSDRLKATAETKVVFHTADLTPSERSVVEEGLVTSHFDVCFATPTLAAGVNFPFRTVLFDRIRRRYIQPPDLPLSSYRNMSGRAGRLGMHDKGFSILIPRDKEELDHANILIRPENEKLFSKLASMSVRKIVMSLIASKSANSQSSIREFLEQTLFWYQVRDRNAVKLDELVEKIDEAIIWLADHDMVTRSGLDISATDLGAATARSGLLPSTSFAFAELLKSNWKILETSFEDYELGLIHAICCCDEFDPDIGHRFLPAIGVGSDFSQITDAVNSCTLFVARGAGSKAANHSAYAIFLFISGEIERKISATTGVPSGQVHRFAGEIAWMLDGMHKIASVSSITCSQKVMNQIAILARRVRTGAPSDLVDLIRTAQDAKVPGFGRQRALTLLRAKLADRESILKADPALLEKLLASKERADRLIEAIEQSSSNHLERAKRLHLRIASQLGIEQLVADAYDKDGNAYEEAIEALLRLNAEWVVTRLEDGKRKSVPDLMIQYNDRSIVLECKTTTKKPPTISKDEAFAVLIKAADIKDVHCVTLGKPGFDTFSESKACGSSEITLISHAVFVAALLLKQKQTISSGTLFDWIGEPGVAEIERLGTLIE